MSERMVLSCEISRANASVRWYRNGLEVEENNNLILEVDGVYRRLIIPETTVSDSAEYVCDTVDDSVTFFVNIAGTVIDTTEFSARETKKERNKYTIWPCVFGHLTIASRCGLKKPLV